MFSRVALRSGAHKSVPITLVRSTTTAVGVRDEKNFPRPVRLQECPKVRFGFIPDDWFLFFHKKTGVTGPYLFGVGVINYLVSKEWYVMEHEYYTGLSILLMVLYVQNKLGPQIAEYIDKGVDETNSSFTNARKSEIEDRKSLIAHVEKEVWRADGQEILIEAKKENVYLQLEAAYRERLMVAYQAVKQRLDYQLEKQNIEKRIAQRQMADWIIENVLKSITPDQEKATISQCIGDLTALASRSK